LKGNAVRGQDGCRYCAGRRLHACSDGSDWAQDKPWEEPPMPSNRRQDEPIPFGLAYAQSETFRTMFRNGMRLVEETADYLDGEGRAAARELGRPASIVYATESMRLTTRLMQLASWLLLHRSVNEGDMSLDQAREEKRKIRLDRFPTSMTGPGWSELPEEFLALIRRSLELQKRIERIEAALPDHSLPAAEGANPVAEQQEEIAAAFNRRGA
jgi:regulator of CtrA degradation